MRNTIKLYFVNIMFNLVNQLFVRKILFPIPSLSLRGTKQSKGKGDEMGKFLSPALSKGKGDETGDEMESYLSYSVNGLKSDVTICVIPTGFSHYFKNH